MIKVTIYTTASCPYCKMAKQFMGDNNISFAEVDVTTDIKAQEAMIAKSGQLAVPVLVVKNDSSEEVMVGFDRNRLATLLGVTS